MRINISYRKPLTFEQFKEQFEQHFNLSNDIKKEAEMKKAWEVAESKIIVRKPIVVEDVAVDIKVEEPIAVIETEIALDQSGNIPEETKPRGRNK